MDKKQTVLLDELRKYLRRSNSIPEEDLVVSRVRGLLLNESGNPDTNPHVRLLAGHLLWHFVLNCRWKICNVFLPKEQFPYVDLEKDELICVSTLLNIGNLDFVTLALLNGFINASSDEICIEKTDKSIRLIDILELLLKTSVKYKPGDNFFHFTVLKNCLLKFQKIISSLQPDFMQIYRSSIERLWALCQETVHCYWDSRYPGVQELVIDIYQSFVSIINRLDKNLVKIDRLLETYIQDYPYFVRGKYKIVAVLVEFLDVQKFERIENDLLSSFRLPMYSSYLSPMVGTVYKTVVSFLAKQKDPENGVLQKWILLAADFLCSSEKDLAFNAARHFLPILSKCLPFSYNILKENVALRLSNLKQLATKIDRNIFESIDLSNLTSIEVTLDSIDVIQKDIATKDVTNLHISERVHWAYAVIVKYDLKIKEQTLSENDKQFLYENLTSRDDNTRIECFQTLFDPSLATSGSFMDNTNMEYFLLNNLTVSDSTFRRRLFTFFKKWATFRMEQDKKRPDIEFRKFSKNLLLKLCSNLFPSASYQRLTTSLNLIQILLNSVPENSDFYGEMVSQISLEFLAFIRCLQNSSHDIREISYNILLCCVQYPLRWNRNFHFSHDGEDDRLIYGQLLNIAKTLSNSPKELDCESASTIWKLLFKKFLFELKFSLVLKIGFEIVDLSEGSLEIFRHFLNFQFETLKQSLHKAAINNPLHGYLLAFCTFLKTVNEQTCPMTSSTANRILNLISTVSDYFLTIFGSSRDGECPSLEEMDVAILAECTTTSCESLDFSTGGAGVDVQDSLSTDRQLVLACCWLNIKDCAAIGAELTLSHVTEFLDFVSLLIDIGDFYFNTMTRTRHWGVLDGCEEGFTKFCNFCFASNESAVRIIPENLLTKTNLVARAFELLLEISRSSFDALSDGRTDIAVVRAVHCLRLLLRCSTIGLHVLPYTTECYRLVLKYFSSPVWPLRNSVVLMLASINWRLFGRRNVLVDSSSETSENENSSGPTTDIATSLCEFRANFDEIWRICCESIKDIVDKWKTTKYANFVDISLYPIFTILQNICLIPGQELAMDTKRQSKFYQILKDTCLITCDFPVSTLVINLRQDISYLMFHLSDSRLRRIAADIYVNFSISKFDAEKLLSISNELFVQKTGFSMNKFDNLLYLAESFLIKQQIKKDTIVVPSPNMDNLDVSFVDLKTFNFSPAERLAFFVRMYDLLKKCILCKSSFHKNSFSQSAFRSFLLDCCGRKYGISIQSLSLPLLTAFMDNPHNDGLWLEFMHQCSNETRNETCRYAAAYSYCIIGPLSVIRCQNSPNLFFDAVNLFLDEDSDIRDIMCNLFSEKRDISTPKTSHLYLQRLFDYVTVDNMDLCKSLCSRLNFGEKEEFTDLEQLFSTGEVRSTTFLFKQKDFNIYKEEFLIVSLCYKALKRLCKDATDKNAMLTSLLSIDIDRSLEVIDFGIRTCLRIIRDKNDFNICCTDNADKLLIPAFKIIALVNLYNLYYPNFWTKFNGISADFELFSNRYQRLFCSVFDMKLFE